MNFPTFKAQRMADLATAQWGDARIPDLLELLAVAKPRSVLEIGCWRGVSTEVFLLHAGRVVAIDPWPEESTRRAFIQNCGHYPHLTRIQGYSPMALSAIDRGDFDLAYIDGDHDYEPVKADIRACFPFVQGGWIGGHDYGGDCPGVEQAVLELLGEPSHRFSDGSWLMRTPEVCR